MNRKDFADAVAGMVKIYLDNSYNFDENPQLRVNPVTFDFTIVNGSDMLAEIEDSNEAVEDAAGAEGDADADEAATDMQVKQNPDFYSVRRLITTAPNGSYVPDEAQIDAIAALYFA
jgi:hypothetical protein